jgi:hypothetical protein
MFRTAIVVFTLTLGPSVALAQESCGHERQAMSCAEGMVWDADSRTCIQPST